ncbi:MAG: metallophosphoesterase [Desulfomicrobium sp.]|uniref:metallophosphoesterase family protein n=1 Tax=Pseudodesulfovibrio sp. TaxID=2035812 RepID=UPI001EC6690C|nr:metallophosphoesterase [Pseudodesulfovibrio sp.]MBV1713473.1 metallophosphoesterase [Desulfomicrobium sp.]MBV1772465.1 metallophosphoesterase [Pseudodesulfovibrio sp.]
MILFVGDAHGDFEPMLEAAASATAIILLGDQEPLDNLASILGPEIAEKTWWIFGNHDSDDPEYLKHHAAMADRNLHCRVVEIDGLRIAGLGGTFRSNILGVDRQTTLSDLPHVRPQDTRQSLAMIRKDKKLAPQDHTTIFPEDLNFMARLGSKTRVDVVVSHEAPESHKLGYRILGDVARALRAKILIHAHHHERYDAVINGGIKVAGVGMSGMMIEWLQPRDGLFWLAAFPGGNVLAMGYDPKRKMYQGEFIGLDGCKGFTAPDLNTLQEEGTLILETFLKRPKRR